MHSRIRSRGPLEALEVRRLLAATVGGWTPLAAIPVANGGAASDLQLTAYKAFALDRSTLAGQLYGSPAEDVAAAGVGRSTVAGRVVSLPAPDGSVQRFRVVRSSVMADALAAANPTIRTYAGVGVDDPAATVRLDLTPLGFHAQVRTTAGSGSYDVDPYARTGRGAYVSYYASDSTGSATLTDDDTAEAAAPAVATDVAPTAARASGTQLRTYRLAVSCTGEYAAYFGGTASAALSAVVTAVNRVSGIYESELSIRLQLVSGESSLIYTNANTDPFSNGDPSSLLSQNQSVVDSKIGAGNYDIGHVFSTAGGGLAALGVVGRSGSKAEGETGTSAPTGDAFYVDYVAHEMGHQFGANHSFNTSTDSNRNAATADEVGSGSTIMSYAGITGSNSDLQAHSDPYFAFVNLDEILSYVDISIPSVGTRTSTGNHAPTVSGGANYSVPANTPFALTATGADADGDAVYYSWEEADLGPARTLAQADNGSSPLFRDYAPTASPTRSFPQLASVLSGANSTSAPSGGLSERLPTTGRTMDFVITARDERSTGGGTTVNSGSPVTVTSVPYTVNGVVTGFGLTDFNAAATVAGGSTQTLTWQVANTTAAAIGTANVALLMSTDGGQTFPITLAASTPNDGSQTVQMPYSTASSAVRFKIAAVGNVFYDINNANLTITSVAPPTTPTPTTTQLTGTTYGTAGSYNNDGNTVAKATDGSLATFFNAPSANGAYVAVDLGSAKAVSQVKYAPRSGFANRMVGGVVQASNSSTFASGVVNVFTITATPTAGQLTTASTNTTTAYRYWRYLSPNGSYGNVAEFQLFGAGSTVAQLTGTPFGTSGSYNNNGNAIAKATDGNLSTYFDGPTANGNVVGLDLGSAKAVAQVKFAPRSGYASRMVGGTVQASNSSTFASGNVTVYTVAAAPTVGALTTASTGTGTAYRYWRYVAPNGSYGNVAEFQLFG